MVMIIIIHVISGLVNTLWPCRLQQVTQVQQKMLNHGILNYIDRAFTVMNLLLKSINYGSADGCYDVATNSI